jgi:undecaprenyl-diphosphatase
VNIFVAALLGLVQGLTEFIPVSSSGHLVLAHELFDLNEVGLSFDVALHGGTLLALIVFFHKDVIRLAKSLVVKTEETRLAWFLAIATIPAVIAGVLFESQAETSFRSSILVAINLIIVAFFMLGAEKYSQTIKKKTKLEKTSLPQAIGIGFAQALAIVPGVSRSGSTITAGLFAGLDRVSATRFAFLLGIPIIAGALLKTMLSGGMSELQNETSVFAVGVVTAFVSGMFAIKFLLKYLSKHSIAVFAYYRIGLGLLVLALAFL